MAPLNDDNGNGNNSGGGGGGGGGEILRDQISTILVHVGETRKGIRSLEHGQTELRKAVEDLRDAAITRSFCSEKHDGIQRQFVGVERELAEMRRKTGTGMGHRAVGPQGFQTAELTGPHLVPPAAAVEEVLEKRQEKRRRTLAFYLSVAGGIITLITTLSLGAAKLVRLLDKVERTAEAAAQTSTEQLEKMRQELQEEIANKRIVYIKAPSAPDAGPPRVRAPRRAPKRKTP